MSGPIVPPLEVTEVDGSPDGRPITKIIVSNGDLTISGRTATIDTSGSSTTPGGSDTEIQFNDGGAFAGDAGFVMSVAGDGSTTVTQTGNILTGGNKGLATASANGTIHIISDGTGEIILQSENDQGGTWTNSVANIMCNTNTDAAQLKFRDGTNTDNGSITLDGSGHMILNNNVAAKDIDLKVLTTGQVEVANQTTDTVIVLSIMGNGAGDARIDMQNASERVWVVMDTNKKLKVQGGSGGDTFIFDVSSATGGITFPDSTTQITAAVPAAAVEGTAILSTGETGATKFLREDGDNTCSWQTPSGGGGGFALPEGSFDATYKFLNICTAPPYGTNCPNDFRESLSLNVRPRYFPFISPISTAPTSLVIDMDVAGSGTAVVGIYDARTADNYPGVLVATGEYDPSSTGAITITNTLSTAMVAGSLYFYAVRNDNNSGELEGIDREFVPSAFPSWRAGTTDENTALTGDEITSGTALPATAAYGNGNPDDSHRPYFWLVV